MNRWEHVRSTAAGHKCGECGKMIKKGEAAARLTTYGFKPKYYHPGKCANKAKG